MEAAEVLPGQAARILASDREVTRLGESVFRTGSVSEDAMKSASAVLTRMAGLYRKLDVIGVRAVATSAIRDAHNQREFLARASAAAGTDDPSISGGGEEPPYPPGGGRDGPQEGKRDVAPRNRGGRPPGIAPGKRRPRGGRC